MWFVKGIHVSCPGNCKTLDRCLWMRRAGQWNGHAVENMFLGGVRAEFLKWTKFQNVMHVCFTKQKLNDQIKSKTSDHFQ